MGVECIEKEQRSQVHVLNKRILLQAGIHVQLRIYIHIVLHVLASMVMIL